MELRMPQARRYVHPAFTDSFNDIDDDPMFMKAAWVGETAYFPTFEGSIQPARPLAARSAPDARAAWRLATDLPDAPSNARPSGWQVISADGRTAGSMSSCARTRGRGDHKFGGETVWVVDPVERLVTTHRCTRDAGRFDRGHQGCRATAARGHERRHATRRVRARRVARKLRTIGGWGSAMPLALHAVR